MAFTCTNCGKSFTQIPAEFAGKRVKCPCGKVTKISDEDVNRPATNPSNLETTRANLANGLNMNSPAWTYLPAILGFVFSVATFAAFFVFMRSIPIFGPYLEVVNLLSIYIWNWQEAPLGAALGVLIFVSNFLTILASGSLLAKQFVPDFAQKNQVCIWIEYSMLAALALLTFCLILNCVSSWVVAGNSAAVRAATYSTKATLIGIFIPCLLIGILISKIVVRNRFKRLSKVD